MQVVSKGWHNDKLVSKTADARLVLHYGAGKIGTSFRLVRSPDVVLTVFAEPGTGLAIDHDLTLNPGVEHATTPASAARRACRSSSTSARRLTASSR